MRFAQGVSVSPLWGFLTPRAINEVSNAERGRFRTACLSRVLLCSAALVHLVYSVAALGTQRNEASQSRSSGGNETYQALGAGGC